MWPNPLLLADLVTFTEEILNGCSFVAKLSLKKKFFLKKYLCFLQNIHDLQKKIILYGKKKLYWFFFAEKIFTENEKGIYLIWEIFFYPENIYSFCKKNFWS